MQKLHTEVIQTARVISKQQTRTSQDGGFFYKTIVRGAVEQALPALHLPPIPPLAHVQPSHFDSASMNAHGRTRVNLNASSGLAPFPATGPVPTTQLPENPERSHALYQPSQQTLQGKIPSQLRGRRYTRSPKPGPVCPGTDWDFTLMLRCHDGVIVASGWPSTRVYRDATG